MPELITPDFNIGDLVYHATDKEGEQGIVIDITYSYKSKYLRYVVSFGRREEDEMSMVAEELTKSRPL